MDTHIIHSGPYKPGLQYHRPTSVANEFKHWNMGWSLVFKFLIADIASRKEGNGGLQSYFKPAAISDECWILRVPHPIPGGRGGITRVMLGIGLPSHMSLLSWVPLKSSYSGLTINEDQRWGHFAFFWGKSNLPRLVLPCRLGEMDALQAKLDFLRKGTPSVVALRRSLGIH